MLASRMTVFFMLPERLDLCSHVLITEKDMGPNDDYEEVPAQDSWKMRRLKNKLKTPALKSTLVKVHI